MSDTKYKSSVSLWFGRLLPVLGLVILVCVLWRQQQLAYWSQQPSQARTTARALAPRFELMDHNRHLVKFERFLGRQRVVVVFFDEELGANNDPRLQALINNFEALKANSIEVIAISTAMHYQNEKAEKQMPGQACPFPLLTDVVNRNPIPRPTHRQWGAYDEQSDSTVPGMYLVARDGTVSILPNGKPKAVVDEANAIESLTQGKWPVR